MLKTQFPYIDEEGQEHSNLILTYSDKNMQILQIETDCLYSSAVDVYPCRFTYKETDIPIPEEDETEE